MAIKYPAQLDNSSNLPTVTDGYSVVAANLINAIRDAVVAIEAELGIKPSGSNTTVKARLNNLDNYIYALGVTRTNSVQ